MATDGTGLRFSEYYVTSGHGVRIVRTYLVLSLRLSLISSTATLILKPQRIEPLLVILRYVIYLIYSSWWVDFLAAEARGWWYSRLTVPF